MRYYRLGDGQRSRLVVETDGRSYDLTSANPRLGGFGDLARAAVVAGTPIDEVTDQFVDDAAEIDEVTLALESRAPIAPDEVWTAATPRYDDRRSSGGAGPRRFRYKATARRTAGPNEDIGVRPDLQWSFPEPELGVVLHGEHAVGYVVALDVAGGFETGAAYHPQANVYERCCAIGPCVATRESLGDSAGVSMTIARDDTRLYEQSASPDDLLGTSDRMADEFGRYDAAADVTLLLTGSLLPPDRSLSLRAGDLVTVGIDGVGTLETSVADL